MAKQHTEENAMAKIYIAVADKKLTASWKKQDLKSTWLTRARRLGIEGYSANLKDAFIDATKEIDFRANNGGNTNAGRKKKERVEGDEPKNTTVQVEPSVIKACKDKHGSLANALRFAAK